MLYITDSYVGLIMEKLKQLNLSENTIIMFMSDNGGQIVSTYNTPLRGQKANLYEGGIRVPLIIKWDKHVKASIVSDVPVSIVDVFPTLSDISAQKVDNKVDGESLVPLFANKKLKRSSLFWHLPSYNGNGKSNALVWQFPGGVIRKNDWKLIQNFEDNSVQLFNLKKDIGEKNDVSASNPKIVKSLLTELQKWQKKTNAPIPTELNPAFKESSREWIKNSNQRNLKETENLKHSE